MMRTVLAYGAGMAALLVLLHWLEWRFIIFSHGFEIYASMIAVLFTALGIWLAVKLTNRKAVVVREPMPGESDIEMISKLAISKRELEVLQLMADGLSNQQIADRLFVSLNTIKTHNANLFAKLDVNKRTQAIKSAKQLRLIP